MEFYNILPSDNLKPYIKSYKVYTTFKDNLTEVIYPSGYIELAINISTGNLTTIINDQYIQMPSIEVLGHFTSPVKLMITKKITLLVVRFYSHASSFFFPNKVCNFTNDSIDLNDVFNKEASELYHQMMEQNSINQKIGILEKFLIQKLRMNEKKQIKFKLIESLCNHAPTDKDFFNIKSLAAQYGYSERHIQKLFLEFVGLTPKSFYNIQRFNKSLKMVQLSNSPLTSIAYECGYFDQSHFIKEFKELSGVTPSQFQQLPI